MNPLIVEHVSKSYRQGGHAVEALRGVDLAVEPARFVAVMGASGSGKSTLLHLMAGLADPDTGRVLVAGHDLADFSDTKLTRFRRRHIGLVFQAFNLVPTLSALENVALPLLLDGERRAEADERANAMLRRLRLDHRASHRPDALSGGEQQRVAIARALVPDPDVVLADEPTGNLDSANGHRLCELLRELADHDGRSLVMVTHEAAMALHAHEAAVLHDGRLIDRFDAAGLTPQDLALRYQSDTAGPADEGPAAPDTPPAQPSATGADRGHS